MLAPTASCQLPEWRQSRQCQVRASSQFIALQLSQSANVPATSGTADTRTPAVGNPSDRGVYVTWTVKPSLAHIKRVKSSNLTQLKVEWGQKQSSSNTGDRDKGVTQAFCIARQSAVSLATRAVELWQRRQGCGGVVSYVTASASFVHKISVKAQKCN